MANFPTTPATGSYFETSGSTYVAMGDGIWRVAAPESEVKFSAIQDDSTGSAGTGSAALLDRARPAQPADEANGLLTLSLTSGSSNTPDAETTDVKLYIQDDGVDSNTVLLLHCDGADDGTSFTDSSPSGHTVTAAGNAKTDNGASVFGTSSAYFDGTGDYLDAADSTDFDFGTGDFTVEFWVYFTAFATTYQDLIGTANNAAYLGAGKSGWVAIYHNTNNRFRFSYQTNNSWGFENNFDFEASLNRWYHVAYTREGTSMRCFVNGVQINNTITNSTDIVSTEGYCRIGGGYGNTSKLHNGYLDEIRISTVCRYSGSQFDLPTKQFGRPDLKLKDGSGTYTIKLKQIN